MGTMDDDAYRQTRLTHAILETITGAEAETARSCLERVVLHGEPWTEGEGLVIAALRIAAMDPSVLSAVNNAAQILTSKAELAAEAEKRLELVKGDDDGEGGA